MDNNAILIVGSVNVDFVVKVARLPHPGETVTGGSFFRAFGGKGANQAVAAARASRQKAAFVGMVGNDANGHDCRLALAQEKIDVRHLQADDRAMTGVALIMVDEHGENMISVASGANMALTPEAIFALPESLFETAAVLMVSLEIPLAAAIAALTRARRHKIFTLLNPAPATPDLLQTLDPSLVDLIIPNEIEAAAMVGACEPASIEEAQALAAGLQRRGFANCIITLGAQGCMLVQQPAAATSNGPSLQAMHLPAIPVRVVDTTAAGDAFCGALAAALAERQPLLAAARFAQQAAAISVTRLGAQPSLPTREEIDAFGQ